MSLVGLVNDPEPSSNAAWADALAKILRQKKPQNRKYIVLSRAKKIQDSVDKSEKKSKDGGCDFEVVNEDVEEKEKKFVIKEYQAKGRVKPSILEKDRERMFAKIATKGVVQLFNAVRQQQKTVEKSMKSSRRSVVQSFNAVRQQQKTVEKSRKRFPLNENIECKDEDMDEEEKCTWSVLSDNFMMGSELKGWDQHEEDDRED